MSRENPTLDDFGINLKELMIELQRETMGKLIAAEKENKRFKDGLTEIFHFADTHCEGAGEPEFSWFGWIASRATAALQQIPK